MTRSSAAPPASTSNCSTSSIRSPGDKRKTYSANLPNRGAVPALPPDAILELTAVATARGLQPLLVPDFPPILAAPLIRKIAAVELTVRLR